MFRDKWHKTPSTPKDLRREKEKDEALEERDRNSIVEKAS